MCPPTRLRILDYLRKQQTASVHELSSALAMTGANVRHHLAVLESNDLIEYIGQRREARGRPVNIYGLSRRVLGDGLDGLAGALLKIWFKDSLPTAKEDGLRSVAMQLGGENLPISESPLPRRLNQLVDRLNELYYQARWEAGAEGARLILGHCPYAAIISSHPELCQMDAFLLEKQAGLPVEQTAKLQPSAKGVPFCTFRLVPSR
jgi:predicted ArsR family transcriptional regulator